MKRNTIKQKKYNKRSSNKIKTGGNRSINKSKRNKTIMNNKINNKKLIGASVNSSTGNDFIKASCAPNPEGGAKKYSCYSDEALMKLRNLWNQRHPDVKITSEVPYEVWKELKMHMSNVCNNEQCWLKQSFVQNNLDNDLISYTFAPSSPSSWKKNRNEWLSSVDIEKVMKQYEKKYICFDFIGPSPIDFDSHVYKNECVWKELCEFNLSYYLSKGKNKIGIIFNTDPHYKDGSHWISLFINIRKGFIFYFDSNGNPVPKEIKALVDRIIEQGKLLNINLTFDQNYPTEHQYGNTECGMYSLYFIIQMLKDNHDINYFKNHRIKDEDMEELRGTYFNIGGT